MVTEAIPIDLIIDEDHRLEAQSDSSARALMQHRWHWTLDEGNSRRMSLRRYAEAVGRQYSLIYRYAKGYVLLLTDHDNVITPGEAQDRAGMGAETEAATTAVAQAHGLTFSTARQERQPEVRRVRDIARERAEERGTSVAEEAPQVARMLVEMDQAQEQTEEQRRQRLGYRYIEIENELDKARRHLLAAARQSEGIVFASEHRDLLAHTLDNIRRLLELMDRAIIGQYSPDWGETLRLVEGGIAS